MHDYTPATEVPGNRVSREAIDMVWTRYKFAATFAKGKRVLEIGCGPGVGLTYLSQQAARIVAGDSTGSLLVRARAAAGGGVPLARFDAHALPFCDGVFDVVVLLEAVYFFADARAVVASCCRVLSPGGIVVIVTVNPEWTDFNPNSMATRYLSAADLQRLFTGERLQCELFGGFPAARRNARGVFWSPIRRAAVRLHLVPKTMRGKELLKRVVFGRLVEFPVDTTSSDGVYYEPTRLHDLSTTRNYKVLYAVGRKTTD